MTSIFGTSSLFGSLGLTGSSSGNGLSTTQVSTTPLKTSQSSSSSLQSSPAAESPEQKFLDYMHKPLAQRIRDAWLAAHHLTEDDLKNMSPSEREAIEKQMAADLKAQMQQQAQAKASKLPAGTAGVATLLASSL